MPEQSTAACQSLEKEAALLLQLISVFTLSQKSPTPSPSNVTQLRSA